MSAQGEVDLFGFVEADHDVARVEVGVDEIVDEEHVQESVETFVRDLFLKDAAAVFEEGGQGDAGCEFFDQDLTGGVFGVRVGEPGCGAVSEFFAKHDEVCGFDAEVEL